MANSSLDRCIRSADHILEMLESINRTLDSFALSRGIILQSRTSVAAPKISETKEEKHTNVRKEQQPPAKVDHQIQRSIKLLKMKEELPKLESKKRHLLNVFVAGEKVVSAGPWSKLNKAGSTCSPPRLMVPNFTNSSPTSVAPRVSAVANLSCFNHTNTAMEFKETLQPLQPLVYKQFFIIEFQKSCRNKLLVRWDEEFSPGNHCKTSGLGYQGIHSPVQLAFLLLLLFPEVKIPKLFKFLSKNIALKVFDEMLERILVARNANVSEFASYLCYEEDVMLFSQLNSVQLRLTLRAVAADVFFSLSVGKLPVCNNYILVGECYFADLVTRGLSINISSWRSAEILGAYSNPEMCRAGILAKKCGGIDFDRLLIKGVVEEVKYWSSGTD